MTFGTASNVTYPTVTVCHQTRQGFQIPCLCRLTIINTNYILSLFLSLLGPMAQWRTCWHAESCIYEVTTHLVGGLNLLVRKVADLQRLLELIHGLGAGATSHHHVQQGVVSLRLDLQRLLQPEGPRGRFSSHTERWSAATNAIKLGEQRTASSILSSISPAICTSLHCAHCCLREPKTVQVQNSWVLQAYEGEIQQDTSSLVRDTY